MPSDRQPSGAPLVRPATAADAAALATLGGEPGDPAPTVLRTAR